MKPLKVNTFWAAPIWEVTLPFDDAFNKALLVELKAIGQKLVTEQNPPDSLWDYDLPHLNQLKQKMLEQVTFHLLRDIEEANSLNIGFESSMAWPNVRGKGESLEIHAHTDCTIAATYYVSAKPDCGDLILYDGTPTINWINGKVKPALTDSVRVKAVESKLVFFPSYILHMGEENQSDDLRVSISCDLKTIVDKTAPNAMIMKSWALSLNKICI